MSRICPECKYPNPDDYTECFKCKVNMNEAEANRRNMAKAEKEAQRIQAEQEREAKRIEAQQSIPVNSPSTLPPVLGNDSGMGQDVKLPERLNRLNWGGFLLSFFWGYAHILPRKKLYLTTICIIAVCVLFGMSTSDPQEKMTFFGIYGTLASIHGFAGFVFLLKGNEMAWKARHFESIEHFTEIQTKWTYAGIAVALVIWLLQVILFAGIISDMTKAMNPASYAIPSMPMPPEMPGF